MRARVAAEPASSGDRENSKKLAEAKGEWVGIRRGGNRIQWPGDVWRRVF